MRTKSQSQHVQAFQTREPQVCATQRENRAYRGRRVLRQGILSLWLGGVLMFAPLFAPVGGADAQTDFKKQPIQELLDTDDPVYDIPRDPDYSIDHQPQHAAPDTQDVMDANDAERSTPVVAFFFWLLLAVLVIGALAYAFLRTGSAKAAS